MDTWPISGRQIFGPLLTSTKSEVSGRLLTLKTRAGEGYWRVDFSILPRVHLGCWLNHYEVTRVGTRVARLRNVVTGRAWVPLVFVTNEIFFVPHKVNSWIWVSVGITFNQPHLTTQTGCGIYYATLCDTRLFSFFRNYYHENFITKIKLSH